MNVNYIVEKTLTNEARQALNFVESESYLNNLQKEIENLTALLIKFYSDKPLGFLVLRIESFGDEKILVICHSKGYVNNFMKITESFLIETARKQKCCKIKIFCDNETMKRYVQYFGFNIEQYVMTKEVL